MLIRQISIVLSVI